MKNSEPAAVRILLVDDNALGSEARRMILTESGYTVETASSGEAAWELFQKQHFDIVVTDYRMPGMDGFELIRLIRGADRPSPARIILLSGRIEAMGMTEKSTGADELIRKSNKEVPELLRAVKSLAARPHRRGPDSYRNPTKKRASGAS